MSNHDKIQIIITVNIRPCCLRRKSTTCEARRYLIGDISQHAIIVAIQHGACSLRELSRLLEGHGVEVSYAIHPVAGRMPGHMNVLLAEAGVPYDLIYDMEDINADFANTTVTLVIGANDVVNPAAKNDPNSPLFGMPILNAELSDNVIVIKRGRGTGFSGVENPLFLLDNTRMLFGDGQKAVAELIQAVKEL